VAACKILGEVASFDFVFQSDALNRWRRYVCAWHGVGAPILLIAVAFGVFVPIVAGNGQQEPDRAAVDGDSSGPGAFWARLKVVRREWATNATLEPCGLGAAERP
jgi:hypothetical protein